MAARQGSAQISRLQRKPAPSANSEAMGSVLKTFEVLDVFGQESKPLTIAELVRATGRPKSSLHRILGTLVEAGVLEQNAPGSYRLTLKLWQLGASAIADLDLLKIARPHLEALSRAADETVHLSVLEDAGGVVYLAKVESPRSIRVQTQLGRVMPSWCTATGRALIAFRPDIQDKVLAEPKQKFTPATETEPNRLRELLAEVVERGFAHTKGENHPEMGGIASPIRDHSGGVIASCGVAIPAFRMDDALVERCQQLVRSTASTISDELGWVPNQPKSRERV